MSDATDASAQQRAASSWKPTTYDSGFDSNGQYFRDNSGQKIYTTYQGTSGTDVIGPPSDDVGQTRLRSLSTPGSADANDFQVANTQARDARYADAMAAANARAAPTTNYADANADRSLAGAARIGQGNAASMYQQAANGQGTSVAQANYAQALQQQQSAQASAAASARGGGLARSAAQQTALGNEAAMGQNAAASMASLRAQEIATARAGYAGITTNMRGQDQSQQGQDAGQAQFNVNAAQNQQKENDAQNNFYTDQQSTLATQNFQGQLAKQAEMDQAISADQQQQNIHNGVAAQASSRTSATIGQVATTAGTVLAMADKKQQVQATPDDKKVQLQATQGPSANRLPTQLTAGPSAYEQNQITSDRREKRDIRPADDKMRAFLDALSAQDYVYKHPGTPGEAAGRHASPMAQDLEKSEVGSRLVHNTPRGKVVEYGPEAMASAFAAMAALNKRLAAVEGKK